MDGWGVGHYRVGPMRVYHAGVRHLPAGLLALTMWSVSGQTFQAERKFIYPAVFKPGRPYSPGVLAGKTLYIAGQIDKDPQTGAQPFKRGSFGFECLFAFCRGCLSPERPIGRCG